MNKLLPLTCFFLCVVNLLSQSPHGENFKINCSTCHTPQDWSVDLELQAFDHDTTRFPLEGQHATVDCKLCHSSLVFSKAETSCASCHIDLHNQTLGNDCVRCHTADNWRVDNIAEIHEQNAFPLIGAHAIANCTDCHQSDTDLRFDPIGVTCIDCHNDEYLAATNPNHLNAGFSTECSACHDINSLDWSASSFDGNLFDHDAQYFPIYSGAHEGEWEGCIDCHTNSNDYSEYT